MIEQVCINDVLLESVKEIFETMIFMDIEESSESDQDIDGWALLSSITFQGEIDGCMAICFSIPCAKAVAASMLGMDTTEELTEEDTCDAIGEIANMVMGSMKTRLADSVGDLQVSIPMVISGRELKNNLSDGAERTSINVTIADEHITRFSFLYKKASK